jgi:hypothetical protein
MITDDELCTKCGEDADDADKDGLCGDCHMGEHGPPDSYWEARDSSPAPSKMVGGGFGPYDSDFGRCVR